MLAVADRIPPLGKRELIFLLSFTFNCVVSFRSGFLFLLVLGIDCAISLWHSMCLPYAYFAYLIITIALLPVLKSLT